MTKKVTIAVIIVVVVIGVFTGTKVFSKGKEQNSSEVVLKKKLKKRRLYPCKRVKKFVIII